MPPQRIGLSATQRPLEGIAAFLGGGTVAGADAAPDGERIWTPRPVTVVDAPRDKALEIEIVVPLQDMTAPDTADAEGHPTRSIWPAIYPEILALVVAHRSTIVFSNSRGLVERLAAEPSTTSPARRSPGRTTDRCHASSASSSRTA